MNKTLEKLTTETLQLMKQYGIRTRELEAIKKDSPNVSLYIDSSKGEFEAGFDVLRENGGKWRYSKLKPEVSYFINPVIRCSKTFHDIVIGNFDTSKLIKAKCLSIIVHELVHYLQIDDPNKPYIEYNGKNFKEYCKQQYEWHAYILQAIYFFMLFDTSVLENIKNMNETDERKGELLINKYYQTVGRPIVF